jgi:hypothetical protein
MDTHAKQDAGGQCKDVEASTSSVRCSVRFKLLPGDTEDPCAWTGMQGKMRSFL